MNRNEAIKDLKEFFKKVKKFAEEVKFNNLTLSDGTQVTIKGQDIGVGVEVMQLDDNQNPTPLNPGTYVLQDGRSFTVDETNKITEISTTEEDSDEPGSGQETDNVENAKQKMDGLPSSHDGDPATGEPVEPDTQKDGDMSSRIEDLEKQIEEIVNFLKQLQSSQSEVNEQMMWKIKKIGSEPGSKSTSSKQTTYEGYSSQVKPDGNQITNDFLDKIRKIKMSKNEVAKTISNTPKKMDFKSLLREADNQIKSQTQKQDFSKEVASNQKTESLLEKIRAKKQKENN